MIFERDEGISTIDSTSNTITATNEKCQYESLMFNLINQLEYNQKNQNLKTFQQCLNLIFPLEKILIKSTPLKLIYEVEIKEAQQLYTIQFIIQDSMHNDVEQTGEEQSYIREAQRKMNENNQSSDFQIPLISESDLLSFLSFTLKPVQYDFKTHDLDYLSFLVNLFNSDIYSCRLSLLTIKSDPPSYQLELTANQIIDPNQFSGLLLYQSLIQIYIMMKLSQKLVGLVRSISESGIKAIDRISGQDELSDTILVQMQSIKKLNKQLILQQSEDLSDLRVRLNISDEELELE